MVNVNQRKTLQEGKTGVFHFDFFNYETETSQCFKCELEIFRLEDAFKLLSDMSRIER